MPYVAKMLLSHSRFLLKLSTVLHQLVLNRSRFGQISGLFFLYAPILMTTLTTVVGMLPLALALGEGSEMLQPLAITIVSGLSFSTLVSLLLVPAVYRYLGSNGPSGSSPDRTGRATKRLKKE